MSCFVMDYDLAPDTDHLAGLIAFYKIIAKEPDLPIIFVGRRTETWLDDSEKRAEVILDTFSYAVNNGDRNVITFPAATCSSGKSRPLHRRRLPPTDLGFWRMAQVIGEAVTGD